MTWSKQRLGRLYDVMATHVDRGVTPGVVMALARGGEIHTEALGTMAVGSSEPVRPDTIFRISSMSKPVVAVAAMILVEECVLRLDDPVQTFLPEIADQRVLKRIDGPLDETVPLNRPITLRDLLTFRLGTGGLFSLPPDAPIAQASAQAALSAGPPAPALPPPPDEWIRRFGTLPLVYQPGERWLYHTGAEVLSVLIARASGQPLETFLRQRIFDPLGMKDTSFSVPADKLDRFGPCYVTNPESGSLEVYDPAEGGQWSNPPAFPSGGAGLVSTVDDYMAFGQMLLNNGKLGNEQILSRPSVELMTTNHLTPEQKTGPDVLLPEHFGWGFGMAVVTRRDDAMSVGSYGWDGGMGTSWRCDPREELVGVLMMQAASTSPDPPAAFLDFWVCVYQAIED